MSETVDHFVPVPLRFFEALTAGDLDPAHFIVGVLIAHRCYELRNTAGGVATVRLATLADLCGVSDDTIPRKLDDLRESGWIDFDRPKRGQRIGWRVWLKGLALNGEAHTTFAPAPHHLRTSSAGSPPPVRRSSSAASPAADGAMPYGEPDRTSARTPHLAHAREDETKRDEKRREENPLDEEKEDHLVGKTTAESEDSADRPLGEEELAELGTLPLDALHRRHERGEL
jgi:hypothetical protein